MTDFNLWVNYSFNSRHNAEKSSVLFRQDHLFCLPQTVMAVTHSYPGHSCKSWTKGKHSSTNDSHGSQKHWQESSRAQAFSSGENKTVLVIINQRSAQRYLQLWCVLFCCGRMNIWVFNPVNLNWSLLYPIQNTILSTRLNYYTLPQQGKNTQHQVWQV